MCKIISAVSGKGGVGKTTSVTNISAYIAMQGKKVLVVDIDPLHNLTTSFGLTQDEISVSIYDLMKNIIEDEPDDVIAKMVEQSIVKTNTVSIIPAVRKLKNLETMIPSATCPERIVEYLLSFVKDDYEYIFLDCCAGLNMFVKNTLAASDSVLIPVEAHILSSDAIDPVEEMIHTVRRRINRNLAIEGIIITKYQGNTNYCNSVYEWVTNEFGKDIHIFRDPVKYTIKVAEAPSYGLSLHEYAPKTDAAKAYVKIAKEVMLNA